MRKLVFVILILCSGFQQLNAQSFGLLGVGLSTFPTESPSFHSFFDTYNKFYQNDIKAGFDDNWKRFIGPAFSYKYYLSFGEESGVVFGFDLGYSSFKAKNQCKLNNDDLKQIVLKQSNINIEMGLGYKLTDIVLTAKAGIYYMPSMMLFSSIYNDGTKSYGAEYFLNGIYENRRLAGTFGGMLGLKIADLAFLSISANYLFPPAIEEILDPKDTYDEFNFYRTVMSFPKDLNTYAVDPHNVDNVVELDFTGITFSFMLSYYIGE